MRFANPQKNIEQFGLSFGMCVADFGAGPGHYSFLSAKAVGSEGKVFAIDIQPELLSTLKNQARKSFQGNIEVIHGDVSKNGGTKLSDQSVDVVIMSNVLFQIEDKEGMVREAFRILKTKGRVIIIDWSESFKGLGPPESDVVPYMSARELLEKAQFVYNNSIDPGAHHYGAIFRKP